MSKAEEQALEVYPIKEEWIGTQWHSVLFDINTTKREGFIKGFNRAEKNLMEKAKQWFTDNIPSEKVQLLWCEFEQFITEN